MFSSERVKNIFSDDPAEITTKVKRNNTYYDNLKVFNINNPKKVVNAAPNCYRHGNPITVNFELFFI